MKSFFGVPRLSCACSVYFSTANTSHIFTGSGEQLSWSRPTNVENTQFVSRITLAGMERTPAMQPEDTHLSAKSSISLCKITKAVFFCNVHSRWSKLSLCQSPATCGQVSEASLHEQVPGTRYHAIQDLYSIQYLPTKSVEGQSYYIRQPGSVLRGGRHILSAEYDQHSTSPQAISSRGEARRKLISLFRTKRVRGRWGGAKARSCHRATCSPWFTLLSRSSSTCSKTISFFLALSAFSSLTSGPA